MEEEKALTLKSLEKKTNEKFKQLEKEIEILKMVLRRK